MMQTSRVNLITARHLFKTDLLSAYFPSRLAARTSLLIPPSTLKWLPILFGLGRKRPHNLLLVYNKTDVASYRLKMIDTI